MSYEDILVETRDRVDLIMFDRPKTLNALDDTLMDELDATLLAFNTDANIGAIITTSNEKVLAAGADIGAMADHDFATVYKSEYITRNWGTIHHIRKSVIATMVGYALGGGCELAMMCDITLAAGTARFGQSETELDTMSGAGGTQCLPRAVSRAEAMDLRLTARMTGVEEVEHVGLISRIIPADKLLNEVIQAAGVIAGLSLPMVMTIKEPINTVYETSPSEGVHLECRLFHSTSAIEDQKEGMRAFIEKCAPAFKRR